jgi:hypothetical protein
MSEVVRLNNAVLQNIQLTSQESMILKSLDKFYEDDNILKHFIPIINSESKISIRLIDHFITKFSKVNKISYKITENNVEQSFNVYSSYKQQLKIYQKRYFDPFSRGDRIPYFVNLKDEKNVKVGSDSKESEHSLSSEEQNNVGTKNKSLDSVLCVITTIGQLNFFKWFISKKIYNYILDNQDLIENDMNTKNKNEKKKPKIEVKNTKNSKVNVPINTSYRPYTIDKMNCDKSSQIVVSFSFI